MRYFTAAEFACKGAGCCGGASRMDPQFLELVDELRHRVGFPLLVSSGYRCPVHNARVSSTGQAGPHTTGRAADFLVYGPRAFALLRRAQELGFTGVGVRQKGFRGSRFLHLDNLTAADGHPRPWVWSY